MSGYKAHLIAGFIFVIATIAGLFYLNRLGFETITTKEVWLFSIPVVFTYSLLPDCDHKTAKITWVFLTISLLMIVGGYVYTLLPESMFIPKAIYLLPAGIVFMVMTFIGTRFKHRGIIHTLLAGFIFSIPLYFIHWFISMIGFIAFFSHLIMDKEVKLI